MTQRNILQLATYTLLLSFVLMPGLGSALDLTLETRVQAGIMDYTFEQKPITTIDNEGNSRTDHGFKIISNMPFAGGGATLFANQFFFDLYLQKAFSGSDNATNPIDDEAFVSIPKQNQIIHSDFDREDYSVSVGYAMGSQWALFVGYRTAKTHFSNTVRVSEDGLLVPENGDIPDNHVTLTSSSKQEVSFKQDGYFLGGAYAFSITEHAVVTLNAALAMLDGKYDSAAKTDTLLTGSIDGSPTAITRTRDTGIDFDGDTIGLNLGVAWKGHVAENFSYSLGANGYNYDFEAKKKNIPDLAESVLRLSAGLSYQF